MMTHYWRGTLVAALMLGAVCLTACLGFEGSGSGDKPVMLESYGIDPGAADSAGLHADWPAGLPLPSGASNVKGGSGSCDFGPYVLASFSCAGDFQSIQRHYEEQAELLGHSRVSFELTPHYISGSTASPKQSLVMQAVRKGGKLQVQSALVEEYDEFFQAGRSVSYSGVKALPPDFPRDLLPIMSDAKLDSASFDNTKLVEASYSVKVSQGGVRDWYKAQFASLGFQHSGEFSSESDMVGDDFVRGEEMASVEIYADGSGCSVHASYTDGTLTIWD